MTHSLHVIECCRDHDAVATVIRCLLSSVYTAGAAVVQTGEDLLWILFLTFHPRFELCQQRWC